MPCFDPNCIFCNPAAFAGASDAARTTEQEVRRGALFQAVAMLRNAEECMTGIVKPKADDHHTVLGLIVGAAVHSFFEAVAGNVAPLSMIRDAAAEALRNHAAFPLAEVHDATGAIVTNGAASFYGFSPRPGQPYGSPAALVRFIQRNPQAWPEAAAKLPKLGDDPFGFAGTLADFFRLFGRSKGGREPEKPAAAPAGDQNCIGEPGDTCPNCRLKINHSGPKPQKCPARKPGPVNGEPKIADHTTVRMELSPDEYTEVMERRRERSGI